MEKTFLLELRDQAKQEPNAELRADLRRHADLISDAISYLEANPTATNMVVLNGLWSRAQRLLMRSEEGVGPEGGGGKMRTPGPRAQTEVRRAA